MKGADGTCLFPEAREWACTRGMPEDIGVGKKAKTLSTVSMAERAIFRSVFRRVQVLVVNFTGIEEFGASRP
jgi:hypothetical protein